ISQGLLYHYFPNKEALLFAVIERHGFLPELRELCRLSSERPTGVVLPELADGLLALFQLRHQLVQIVLREVPTNPDIAQYLEQLIQEGVDLVARYLDARIAAGEVRPHYTSITARALLYTLVMVHFTHVPAGSFLREYLPTLMHGIQA